MLPSLICMQYMHEKLILLYCCATEVSIFLPFIVVLLVQLLICYTISFAIFACWY